MSEVDLPEHFVRRVPDGDTHQRDVCGECGFVHYQNPKVVVGSVVHHEGKLLLCRRSIDPRSGYWTLPAGFMEVNESAAEGAMREAREEAQAELVIESILAVYSIPRLSQVQIIHLARLREPHFAPGPESLEVRLFDWSEIPWDDLAFPSVHWALRQYREIKDLASAPAFSNPEGEDGRMK